MSTGALDSEPDFTVGAVPSESVMGVSRQAPKPKSPSRQTIVICLAVAAFVVASACYLLWPRAVTPGPSEVSAPSVPSPPRLVPTEPAIQHPVGQIPSSTPTGMGGQFPLPRLDDSDVVAKDTIATILNSDAYLRLLVPAGIIRHIVATVDNLPRKTLSARIMPIVPVPGPLATASSERGLSIADGNANRYNTYVEAADAMDIERLAEFYVRLYPLFQQAYVELGYPSGYFNDRLVAVIDHLLAAPEPRAPVYLSQPKVMFEFSEPDLEQLSAGQKILVRVGIDNEMRLKSKLREIRKAVTAEVVKR
jgi:hypothetical protein